MMLGDTTETIGMVAVELPPVAPSMRCADVDLLFQSDPDLGALAVVEQWRPVGLINRYALITHLSRDYGRALYARKPVAELMDRAPLIVEDGIGIDRLESLIADSHPSALLRGFIVTRAGRYRGVGTALSLLQLSMARTERRNRALDRARLAAESATRSKSQFLANMSHELRTPLNAIIGFAEILQKEMFGPLGSGRYAEYVGDIQASGQHLLSLINNILDMSKIESGAWRIQPELADPAEIAAASIRAIRERADAGGIFVSLVVDARLGEQFVDPRALRQILLNLLSNAVKFTQAGGRIEVGLVPGSDGGFHLWVADTGIGIAAEHMDLVLAPFGQVENDLTRRYEGTGLGLPMVKSLVDLHGGGFTIDSKVGQGTTIRIRFPAVRPATDLRPPSPAAGSG